MKWSILFWVVIVSFVGTVAWMAWNLLLGEVHQQDVSLFIPMILALGVILAGLSVKESIDSRSHDLARAAEDRIEVETPLKVVDLLVGDDDGLIAIRNGGAVLALVDVGQLPLALAMVESLWPLRHVTPEAAIQVIDAGLLSGIEDHQTTASSVLLENAAETFPLSGLTYYVPASLVTGWDTNLPSPCRLSLLAYLVHVAEHLTGPETASVDHEELILRLSVLVRLILNVRDDEPEEVIMNTANRLLAAILPVYLADDTIHRLSGPGDGHTALEPLWAESTVAAGRPGQLLHPSLDPIVLRINHNVRESYPTTYPRRRRASEI